MAEDMARLAPVIAVALGAAYAAHRVLNAKPDSASPYSYGGA